MKIDSGKFPWVFSLLKDVRFWIILFFFLRLYGITNPPLERQHTWRQTDGLMIARNFYEQDANILYPRVDLAGDKTGIVGSEFPLVNYLIYLVSLVFGYDHWYGRLIILLVSSIGIFFFYKLIREYFGEPPAFNASIILLVSLWFSYSRKIIPDCFAVSLCLIALYFAFQYFNNGKWYQLMLFFLLAMVGCLIKIISTVVLTVLLIPVLNRQVLLRRKAGVLVFSSLILVGLYAWYFVWVPHLNNTYGFGSHFFMGFEWLDGLKKVRDYFPMILRRLFITPMKYSGAVIFLVALFLVIRKKYWIHLAIFLLPFLSFLVFLCKTGAAIVDDNYYVLALIPALAFITGCGLAAIRSRQLQYVLLLWVGVESIGDQLTDFGIKQPFKSLEGLEVIMDAVSAPSDLVAVNSEFDNPTFMYFAHRRGWAAPNNALTDSVFMSDIISRGCKYIVISKSIYGDIDLNYTKVHDSEHFKVYRITKP